MPLTIPQKTLAELVGIAAKVNIGKSTVAILECLKLRFGAGGLSVESTDMDNWISVSTPDFIAKNCETAIVPCKQFHSIVSGIDKDQSITLSVTAKRMTLKTPSGKYQFGMLPADEWPAFKWDEKSQPINLKAAELIDVLAFTVPSTSRDDARHYLQGVHVSTPAKKKMRFVGCTGHQMARTIIDIPKDSPIVDKGIILPRDLCTLYLELLANKDADMDTTLEITESKCRFEFSGEYKLSLTGRLIDGEFPDIERIIPYSMEPHKSVMPREQTINAIRRVMPLSEDETDRRLQIDFEAESVKFSTKSKSSDGEEMVAVKGSKKPYTVYLGLTKLLSLLQSFTGESITFMNSGDARGGDAIVISDTEDMVTAESPRFSILMPMRG